MERLRADPTAFDFFQAVRWIECAHPERPRVGHSVRADDDAVRFGQKPGLSFAPAAMEQAEAGPAGRLRLFVNFMGLLGPNGPLPAHLTEYARDRVRNHRDQVFVRFLDVFHQRAICLFYDAWARNHQAVSHQRQGLEDRIAIYIASTFGLGMESLLNRDAVTDLAKLHYSGHLVCQTRHPGGLEAILADYFGLRAKIQEFVGQWLTLPENCRCRLGETPQTGALGRTAIVGARVWDCTQRFRLRLGPMGYREYERMLPGGASLKRLQAWVRNYVGDQLSWEVQLVLKKEEVPAAELGKRGQLGWSSWLKSKPFARDAEDLVLRPMG